MKKNIYFKVLGVAAMLGVVGVAIALYAKHQRAGTASLREVQLQTRELKITIQATGDVEALNKVDILPAVPGRIDKILVEEGQTVKKNQVLTWMSSTNRAALLDLAQTGSQLELKQWEQTYQPTPVLAPVTGLITKRDIVPGMTVSAQSILFSMSDRLVIRAQVDETDIGKITDGMRAEVTVDAFPNHTFGAVVHLIGHDSQLVNSVNIYLVELWPARAPDFLRSGMTANINFILDVKPAALAVPLWAVQGHENDTVNLFTAHGETEPVKLGVSDGKYVEVLSDNFKSGDFVFIKPVEIRLETKNDPFSGPTAKRKIGSK
jgi:macrolide-specific efflux system membrane fusion protein